MPKVIEGALTQPSGQFAVVAARFNRDVVERLVEGALKALTDHGVAADTIDVLWVPGAFEIPLIAKKLAESGKCAAVICLGAVIRGDTDHYDHICNQAAAGVLQAGLTTGVPVTFGILTCENEQQALDRAGGKEGNKGFDAALAAIEMVDLVRRMNV